MSKACALGPHCHGYRQAIASAVCDLFRGLESKLPGRFTFGVKKRSMNMNTNMLINIIINITMDILIRIY